MNDKLLRKYSLQIENAESFLKGQRNKAIRKNWTPGERNEWVLREPSCKVCKEDYSKDNILTKEHIHPISLGGYERSVNIIAICHNCNSARNSIMFSILSFKGTTDLRSRWPANKNSIREFIIWCHATINEDYEAINEFPHLNEAYSGIRGISYPPLRGDHNRFQKSKSKGKALSRFGHFLGEIGGLLSQGRFGTPQKGGIIIEMPVDGKIKTPCQGCDMILQLPVGYKGAYSCPECELKQSPPKPPKTQNPKPTQRTNDHTLDDFRAIILELLVEDSTSITYLGGQITGYMKSQGHETCNTTEFLKLFNLPRGLKTAIEIHLAGMVSITGENPKFMIQKISEKPSRERLLGEFITLIQARIPATTYKDGFKVNQITYLLIKLRDEYDLAWTGFFSIFGITGSSNIEEKTLKALGMTDLKYEQIETEEGLKIIFTKKEATPPIERRKKADKKPIKRLDKEIPHSIEEFKSMTLKTLEASPKSMSTLTSHLRAHMKKQGHDVTTGQLLSMFGLPRGFRKALETHMADTVVIGKGSNPKVSQKLKQPVTGTSKPVHSAKGDWANDRLKSSFSYALMSALSHERIETGPLGGNIINRLRKEGIIAPDGELLPHYGYPKSKGFFNVIRSDFERQVNLFQDDENPHRWHAEAKSAPILKELESELIIKLNENGGTFNLLDFWGMIVDTREKEEKSSSDFWRQLGIKSSGTIFNRAREVLDRLKVSYSLQGWNVEGEEPAIFLSAEVE